MKIYSILAALFLLLAGIETALFLRISSISPPVSHKLPPQRAVVKSVPPKSTFTLAMVGDVLPIWVKDPFRDDDMHRLLKGADMTFANLECPLSVRGAPAPIKFKNGRRKYREWVFRAQPEMAQNMKSAGIDVVSLANNHMMDYGATALQDTFQSLSEQQIRYAGAGNNKHQAHQPTILERNGTKLAFLSYVSASTLPGVEGFVATSTQSGLAFVYKGKDGKPQKGTLDTLRYDIKAARKKADLVAVSVHWGKEFHVRPSPFQKQLAYAAIDAGADLIIGHHSHSLNGVEIYKNKPIFYSLGNFVFHSLMTLCSQTGIVKLSVHPQGVREIIFFPAYIPLRTAIPRRNDKEGISIVKTMRNLSQELGTEADVVKLNGQSVLKIVIPAQKKADSLPLQEGNPQDFVELKYAVPNIIISMPYATSQNAFHRKLYSVERAFLRRSVAKRLQKAQATVMLQGLRLKVWDAYRPLGVQRLMWDQVRDGRYVANPYKGGSHHNRGAAIDVTLVDESGRDIEMPTGFDDFSLKAHASYTGATAQAYKNRKILRDAMVGAGFKPLSTEWWHFDAPDAVRYSVSDISLEKLVAR